jgi:threonyl-tRNA synthetase
MNCPGHCLMFDHRARSYRELPLRLADFGVLHRNEFSGALTGLTRVRRFQQDDAHIFCRTDQIKQEVASALDFMQHTYGIFGFQFELDLSTRPKKALGKKELWDMAEGMMAEALDAFGKPWRINPGDGAFYGPKIDIKVFDALGRRHQCATIQLDFQLPVRFNLKFKAPSHADEQAADAAEAAEAAEGGEGAGAGAGGAGAGASAPAPAAAAAAAPAAPQTEEEKKAASAAAAIARKEKKAATKAAFKEAAAASGEGAGAKAGAGGAGAGSEAPRSQVMGMVERARSGVDEVPDGFERPVIIHRAILGSVERFMAVLIEHTGGKWPFWLSPRQIQIVPVALKYLDYATSVASALHAEGFYVDVDSTHHTLNKKVREAQVAQYNYILVVGAKEAEEGSVNIRTRDNVQHGTKPLAECIAMLKELTATFQ